MQELGTTADSRITLSGFIQRWIVLHEGGWRPSTKQTNLELLKIITDRFGTIPLEDIDAVQLQGWVNSLAQSRSGSAVKHIRQFLLSIFVDAVEQDYLRKSPARSLRLPRLKAIAKPFLSVEQVKSLLKAATFFPRERALLTFIFTTPIRPSELFAMRWKNVDLGKGLLTITETVYRGNLRPYTKTSEEDDAPQQLLIPQAASNALGEWFYKTKFQGEDDFVFPNSEGGFITKETL